MSAQSHPEAVDDLDRLTTIITEFATASQTLHDISPAVTIFGSARLPSSDPLYIKAETLARQLSDKGFNIVTGGGPGIMEAGNLGAFQGKSRSVGLNIALPHEQESNRFQDISLWFHYFFTRKTMFSRSASAYVIFPGGFGTIDEVSEVIMLIQTRKAPRVPVILVGSDFWQGFIDWIRDHCVPNQFIAPEDLNVVQIIDDIDEIVAVIEAFCRTPIERTEEKHL